MSTKLVFQCTSTSTRAHRHKIQKMIVNGVAFRLISLHTRPDLIKSCIQMLFQAWPKGKIERLDKLERNCTGLPCSLVVLASGGDYGEEQIVYHNRLVPVKIEGGVYLELGCTDSRYRHKQLMSIGSNMVEQYALQLGFKTMFTNSLPKLARAIVGNLGYEFTACRPHPIGSGMLEQDYQVPLSSPYPGLEEYYKPCDESTNTGQAGESSKEPDYMKENPDIPSWAFDVGGYCWIKKDLKAEHKSKM